MPTTNERVPFRLIMCVHCQFQLCWINPRLPTRCPECGGVIHHHLRIGEGILESRDAWLRIERPSRKAST